MLIEINVHDKEGFAKPSRDEPSIISASSPERNKYPNKAQIIPKSLISAPTLTIIMYNQSTEYSIISEVLLIMIRMALCARNAGRGCFF